MTPLQEAARAVKGTMGLPACKVCGGSGEVREWLCGETERDTCPKCGGCGVDTLSPDALTGQAMRGLLAHGGHIELREDDVLYCATFGKNGQQLHDGTPEGVATAFLRLVARCAP